MLLIYFEENIDELTIYYSHYVSVLENKPATKQVLPLSQEDSGQGHGQMSSYEFEPDKESILSVILPQYVESLIYGTILDAKASEHASRMTAMRNASDNATELIDDLSLEYNRERDKLRLLNKLLKLLVDHQLLSNNKRRKSTWELAVTQVMGPVIDVRFEHNEVPEINNALHIEVLKKMGASINIRSCTSTR